MPRTPLGDMPLIDQPFKRVAIIDLVGPIARLTIRPGLAETVPVLTPCPSIPTGRSKCPGYLDHHLCDIYGAPFEKNYPF